ncbi:hypothetical protein BKP45_10075 [Anaerobacillus alkalidiazotrophicus]|uniref:Uncharacterized protein n=1 Tax=Anaerobacillus alkalidiazotrophicus TaxID=472963 RepID=A0A1S2M8Y0_9BACI|nr:hypothetical protein [Anaerobacillus alkalidiazotrophicus]OIJ20125.1 hypothetical protein BKP45_10075 [Anaerobacillus alkalidiazotrophicus]
MEWVRKITPIQGLVMIGTIAVMVGSILIASQSYFSYLEVTEAANGCYDIGGVPIIEKSGPGMTNFHCNME